MGETGLLSCYLADLDQDVYIEGCQDRGLSFLDTQDRVSIRKVEAVDELVVWERARDKTEPPGVEVGPSQVCVLRSREVERSGRRMVLHALLADPQHRVELDTPAFRPEPGSDDLDAQLPGHDEDALRAAGRFALGRQSRRNEVSGQRRRLFAARATARLISDHSAVRPKVQRCSDVSLK